MASRATQIAIAIGGACGAFAALVGSPSTPSAAPPVGSGSGLPMRPLNELARAQPTPPASAGPLAVSLSTAAARTDAAASTNPVASAAATASAPAPAASSATASASTDSTPLPASKAALLRAEMHCDQKDAASCILAARAYEAGSAGVTDADKAAKYRKIALTLWIGQCDHNSASACATLADMYRNGRGVPQNEKNAQALLARTRELCRYNDAPVCHTLPSP